MITALILGTIGSLHCVGMCGPIVLALPRTGENKRFVFVVGRVLYNAGRIVTYILLGLAFGGIGQVISLAGFQSALSITLGVIILLSLFVPFNRFGISLTQNNLWKKGIAGLFRKKSYSALAGIGFLNGFLPCGLVYTALAGAAASGSSFGGVMFMALFGLGTVPALFVVSVLGQITRVNWQVFLRKALPAAAFVLGCLLILRGLNLGIPFISPDLLNMTVSTSSGAHGQ